MGAIDAISRIARGIRDTDGRLSHRIRFSDFNLVPTHGSARQHVACAITGKIFLALLLAIACPAFISP
jgi:hypothetical protein